MLCPISSNPLPPFTLPAVIRITSTSLDNFFLPPSRKRTLHKAANMATTQGAISKRRKFVADGVFYAELNEFFQRELAEEGYSGVEVRVTPTVTDISMTPRSMSCPLDSPHYIPWISCCS